jgi:hypothetical protein
MYRSLDTPESVKRIQQRIWLAKPIQERITLSLQMIDDTRALQEMGLKMRYPHWDEQDVRIHRLKVWLKRDAKLFWLRPIIEQLELEQLLKRQRMESFLTPNPQSIV